MEEGNRDGFLGVTRKADDDCRTFVGADAGCFNVDGHRYIVSNDSLDPSQNLIHAWSELKAFLWRLPTTPLSQILSLTKISEPHILIRDRSTVFLMLAPHDKRRMPRRYHDEALAKVDAPPCTADLLFNTQRLQSLVSQGDQNPHAFAAEVFKLFFKARIAPPLRFLSLEPTKVVVGGPTSRGVGDVDLVSQHSHLGEAPVQLPSSRPYEGLPLDVLVKPRRLPHEGYLPLGSSPPPHSGLACQRATGTDTGLPYKEHLTLLSVGVGKGRG